MISLITVSQAQQFHAENTHERRVAVGLTQAGLATRAGVKLPTLRKFEQTGFISLESFLKISMVLGSLENIVAATKVITTEFSTIDDVLNADKKPKRKNGWRT